MARKTSNRFYKRRRQKGGMMAQRKSRPVKSLPLTGFPNQKMVRLRYVQELQIVTPVSGLSKSLPFVANGCYDPYYPIGGHQPKGFDQWMAVYAHYNVLGSKINVKAASANSQTDVNANGFAWGVCQTPASTELDGKSLEYILENRYQRNPQYVGTHSGASIRQTNTGRTTTYSQKKTYGKNSTSTAELIGDNGKNPDDKTFFEVWMCPINGSTHAKTMNYVVTIDYIVLLTEPKVLTQS